MDGMTFLECGTCGVKHGLPTSMYDSAKREGGFWHCPNGHSRGWKDGIEKTEMANMRRERDRAVQEQARLAGEVTAKEREIKRIKKRQAAGVCGCCNRTFTNMARHMKTKHPELLCEKVVKIGSKK